MATSTTLVNNRTVVHRGSSGIATAFPDVCLTPSPGGPIPVPYPNVARSSDLVRGSSTVTVDGHPVAVRGSAFGRSTGDEPGTQKGVLSRAQMGEARFQNWSFDVLVEGQPACRLLDPMSNNGGSPTNTAPMPEVQPPNPAAPPPGLDTDRGHQVTVTFRYTDAREWTGVDEVVRLGVGYELDGPEHEIWSPVQEYTTGRSFVWTQGPYDLSFRTFDREPRALLPAARYAQLAERARPYLERAQGLIENTLEDVSEVWGRFKADVSQIARDSYGIAMGLPSDAAAALARLEAQMDRVFRELETAQNEVSQAVRDTRAGDWRSAARQSARAARRASDAAGDGVQAIEDAYASLTAESTKAWTDAGVALVDATVALKRADEDLTEALFQFQDE